MGIVRGDGAQGATTLPAFIAFKACIECGTL